MLNTILGLFPFIICFLGIFIWSYKFLFKHNLIENYSTRLDIPRSDINGFLSLEINKKYNVAIIELDVVEEDLQSEASLELKKSDNDDSIYNTPDGEKNWLNFKNSNVFIGILFSFVLSLSIELIVLMMCELTSTFDHDSRLLAFHTIIDTLIFMITIIQPFVMISLYMSQNIIPIHCTAFQKLGTVSCYMIWFLFLHKFGHLSQNFSPSLKSLHTRSLLERKINEIVITGITTMAILSGIGSTTTPYKIFIESGIFNRILPDRLKLMAGVNKQVSELDINNLVQSYNHTNLLLTRRTSDLNKLLVENSGTIYNQPDDTVKSSDNILSHHTRQNQTSHLDYQEKQQLLAPPVRPNRFGGMLHRVQSFASINLNKEDSEENELTNEVNSLKSLRNQLYDDLLKAIYKFSKQKEESLSKNKLFNKILNLSMMFFSIYCAYRIINVIFIRLPYYFLFQSEESHLLHDKTDVIKMQDQVGEEKISTPTRDALAVTITKIIQSIFTNIPLSEDQLVNQIGFILSGGLFLCSFSNVLVTFKSFGKVFPSLTRISNTTKNWLKNLIVSELLAIYVISTALLIRTNLPTNLSNQISRILSLSGSSANSITRDSIKEVEFIDLWFDQIFGLTCIVSIIIIFLRKFINDDFNSKDSYDEYDEEMMVEEDGLIFKTA